MLVSTKFEFVEWEEDNVFSKICATRTSYSLLESDSWLVSRPFINDSRGATIGSRGWGLVLVLESCQRTTISSSEAKGGEGGLKGRSFKRGRDTNRTTVKTPSPV